MPVADTGADTVVADKKFGEVGADGLALPHAEMLNMDTPIRNAKTTRLLFINIAVSFTSLFIIFYLLLNQLMTNNCKEGTGNAS